MGSAMRCSRGEVDVDVEPLRLIAGETAGDALKRLADRVQMVQSFAQAEVGEGPSSRSFCLLVGLRLKSVISYTPRAQIADAHADFGRGARGGADLRHSTRLTLSQHPNLANLQHQN